AIEAAIIAQILKFLGYLITHQSINFKILTTTGGMPSSHSAGVVSLATVVGLICGFISVEFAIATGFAMVVMYDAAGLRRAAGKTAACLNKMMEEFYEGKPLDPQTKLKELLGHTPFEVFVVSLLGVEIAFLNNYILF
ncbi:MAG: divergent PAP2 family protein, partial [bacterium]|nr:divergent PAP2 family protein [bacterium]